MDMSLWPEHPLFDAASRDAAIERLEAFDDGLIFLDSEGRVVSANQEALRQLELEAGDLDGKSLGEITSSCHGWDDLAATVEQGRRTEIVLRRPGSRSFIASPRKLQIGDAEAVRLVIFRDLDALESRRNRAKGLGPQARVQFLAEKRTRADFASQRRICEPLHHLLTRGERAMVQGARILITGESGAGKTEVARFLNGVVADAGDPFITVNCASASDRHFEEAVFGREPLDSEAPKRSLIEQAEGGTLFLDEVGDVPMNAQAKLLGFLEDGVITPVGGLQRRVNHVRTIAATNHDLRRMVQEGRFRADLYYRLAVITLPLPPLREMPALIDHLIDRFLQTINQRRQTPLAFPQSMRDKLADYSFPGNIRELLNIVQKAAIFIDDTGDSEKVFDDLLYPIDVPPLHSGQIGDVATLTSGDATFDLKTEVRRYERALIDKAIRVHGSKRKAAKALGVDIGTIVRKTTGRSEESLQETTAATMNSGRD